MFPKKAKTYHVDRRALNEEATKLDTEDGLDQRFPSTCRPSISAMTLRASLASMVIGNSLLRARPEFSARYDPSAVP